MKKLLFVAVFCILLFATKAQNIKLIKGDEFTSASNAGKDFFINNDSTGFYILNDPEFLAEGGCKLYKFNALTSKKIYEKEINCNSQATLNLVTAQNINERIYVFIQLTNLAEKKVHLIRREFIAATGNEIGQPVIMDEFAFTFETDVMRLFTIHFSPDNKKMLVLKEETTDSRDQIVNVKVYDVNGFKKTWEQNPNTNSENLIPSGYDYLVDNEGRFCYLFENINNEFGIEILQGEPARNKTIMIPAVNITLLNPTLENINNQLICTGEVLEGEKKQKRDDLSAKMGFFLIVADPVAAKITIQSNDYFTEDLQKKLSYTDRHYFYKFEGLNSFHYSKKNYKHYKTFWINNCLYMVKYHGYLYERETTFGKTISYPAQNEIIIIKYKDFKSEWIRLIPGKNTTEKKAGINFMLSGKLHLFYFDNPGNIKKFSEINTYNYKKYKSVRKSSARLICATIEQNGNIKQELVEGDKNTYLHENYSKTFLKQTVNTVITTFNKKKRRFDLISVKD